MSLYNIGKNDKQVSSNLINKLNELIKEKKIYECLVEELLFIVLEKKQPLSESTLKKELIENGKKEEQGILQEFNKKTITIAVDTGKIEIERKNIAQIKTIYHW